MRVSVAILKISSGMAFVKADRADDVWCVTRRTLGPWVGLVRQRCQVRLVVRAVNRHRNLTRYPAEPASKADPAPPLPTGNADPERSFSRCARPAHRHGRHKSFQCQTNSEARSVIARAAQQRPPLLSYFPIRWEAPAPRAASRHNRFSRFRAPCTTRTTSIPPATIRYSSR